MTTTPWHASDDLVTRYADGSLPEADAWSLEKHLERCGDCASHVSRAVREGAAGAVLGEVREALLAEVRGAAEVRVSTDALSSTDIQDSADVRVSADVQGSAEPLRTPSRPAATPLPSLRLRSPRLARVLWAAGPAVRGAWPLAVLFVALGALALAYGADVDGARPLLLAVAPVVPVLGVALSYGPHADPLHEITAATPSGGLRLLLTRTAAVLAVSLPLLTLAGVLLPGPGAPGAAAWLLPGLALTLASLALAGYVGCRAAAAVTGGGWLGAVLVPALASPAEMSLIRLTEQLSACLDGPLAQGAWAAAAVLCAVALAARRSAYDGLVRR